MKVLLHMAITVNGLIARENDDSDFLSGKEWKEYLKMVKRCGSYIMGRRTYEISVSDPNLTFPIPNALNIVMTKTKIRSKWSKVIFTNSSPKEVLKFLKQKGFKSVFLAGGAKLNSSFMKQGLVDEIYIDVVPLAIGKGIKIFEDAKFDYKLRFLGTKKIGNAIQLHYKVIK